MPIKSSNLSRQQCNNISAIKNAMLNNIQS